MSHDHPGTMPVLKKSTHVTTDITNNCKTSANNVDYSGSASYLNWIISLSTPSLEAYVSTITTNNFFGWK